MKETRQDILRVARRAFATTGFQKTTIDSIARMANRGRRTIYTYFNNKAEIYAEVVEMELMEIASSLSEASGGAETLEESLKAYSSVRRSKLSNLLAMHPLLRTGFINRHAMIERLREMLDVEEMKVLQQVFVKFSTGGSNCPGATPSELASLFLAMLKSGDRMMGKGESKTILEKYEKLTVKVFLKGIN